MDGDANEVVESGRRPRAAGSARIRAAVGIRRRRKTVAQYFRLAETLRPMELVYGIVREPAAPRYSHQAIVTHLTVLLAAYVRACGSGEVCVSPVDVVLDRERVLVVQPDIVFIAADRLEIVRDRIWGAPDLVVEVLSPGTARRDRTTKLGWYRTYGVKECWLVDATRRRVEVVSLQGPRGRRHVFTGRRRVRSEVLPGFATPAAACFE